MTQPDESMSSDAIMLENILDVVSTARDQSQFLDAVVDAAIGTDAVNETLIVKLAEISSTMKIQNHLVRRLTEMLFDLEGNIKARVEKLEQRE